LFSFIHIILNPPLYPVETHSGEEEWGEWDKGNYGELAPKSVARESAPVSYMIPKGGSFQPGNLGFD
jgi:hypothetical protein